jgi:hypothetical protein
MPSRAGGLRSWVKGPFALQPDLRFDGYGLRCLQLNTLNNYTVAADRVVVAAELDKFCRNMNSPAEWLRNPRNSMNSRERMPTRVNRRPQASIAEPDSVTDRSRCAGIGWAGRGVSAHAARPPRTAQSVSQHLLSAVTPPSDAAAIASSARSSKPTYNRIIPIGECEPSSVRKGHTSVRWRRPSF